MTSDTHYIVRFLLQINSVYIQYIFKLVLVQLLYEKLATLDQNCSWLFQAHQDK